MHRFWAQKGFLNYLLVPMAHLYSLFSMFFFQIQSPKSVNAKVICVGNIVVGGGGKTPIVQSLIKKHSKTSKVAVILRGYKGALSSNIPIKVDAKKHTPHEVGEEALMHAQLALTYICTNRYNAAKLAEKDGATVIIMDDGLQNNTLKKDINYLVFDGDYFMGNEMLLPAGPLRSSLASIINVIDEIFIINYGAKKIIRNFPSNITPIYLDAKITNSKDIKNTQAIIFCGIANPAKFLLSLRNLNVQIEHKFFFPDHHIFSDTEISKAVKLSKKLKCKILTTSKDYIKIPGQFRSNFVEVKLEICIPSNL